MSRLVVLAAVAVLALAGCAGQGSTGQPSSGDTRFVPGDGRVELFEAADRKPAPAVTGQSLNGGTTALAEGAVTVINFWASWCAPCRAEGPTLKDIASRTKAAGVKFLGVNFKDQQTAAKAYERALAPGYESIYDQSGQVALRFQGTVPPASIPATLIIDAQGRVAARVLGQVKYQTLLDAVTRISSESR